MFGNSFFREMQNDPFFSHHNNMMTNMDHVMSDFHSSFGMPMIGGPSWNPDHCSQQRHQDIVPFGGSMFGSMFSNMDGTFSQMTNNPNSHCYSSSKVISFSNDGSGQPKYYEATSETTQGPGGVRQTRNSERNSQTGTDRMAIGHHIYDRGHTVERSRNRRTGDQEEKQDFLNMDEAEKDAFHREWQEKARLSGRNALSDDRSYYRRREPRAINSAEYHRQNLERSRTRHPESQIDANRSRIRYSERPTGRHGDRHDSRHVRISNHIDEI